MKQRQPTNGEKVVVRSKLMSDPNHGRRDEERPTDPCAPPTLSDEERAFFELRDVDLATREMKHIDELFS